MAAPLLILPWRLPSSSSLGRSPPHPPSPSSRAQGLDYTYYVQPVLFSRVSPEGGPKRGGTRVTLEGAGFSAFVSQSQPLTNAQKMGAARCLWGGGFSSTLTIDGRLRNTPRTSPIATGGLQMSGEAGVTAPDIAAAVLADPDNADAAFSDGDTLTIYFDSETNKAGEGLLTEAGDRELVDKLFSFSHSLGHRYHGRWLDTSSFVIVMVDVTGNSMPAIPSGATVAVIGDIKTANELSRWCKAVSPLSGTTGTQTAPSIANFDAQTWDLSDPGWSRHDTLAVHFDLPTDLGGREGGKAFVDTALAFSQPLGGDYSGVWSDASTFVVTVLDPTGAAEGPQVNETSGAVVSVAGRLQNAPRTSALSAASYRMRVGDFGDADASPSLLRFFARDHDNANASYDAGDQLVVQFDRAVKPGACLEHSISVDNLPVCARWPSGGVEMVDALITLSSPIGANYSGEWQDASTLVVTVTQPWPNPEHAPRPYDTVLRIPLSANVTNLAATAPPLVMGPTLLGVAERVETKPTPPRLVEVLASDFDNRDIIPAAGDTIAIRFDVPTDRGAGAWEQYALPRSLPLSYALPCAPMLSRALPCSPMLSHDLP